MTPVGVSAIRRLVTVAAARHVHVLRFTVSHTPTLARTTEDAHIGIASLKCVTSATGQGWQWIDDATLEANTEYTFSVYMKRVPGQSAIVQPCFYDSVGGWQSGPAYILTDEWRRYSYTCTLGSGTGRRVAMLSVTAGGAASHWLSSAVQVEAKPYATPYCDGSMGAGHIWTGTAHASTSMRQIAEETHNLIANPQLYSTANGYTGRNTTEAFTITPQITRHEGCPYTATWDWGDGSALETGDSMSHAYAAAGTYTVTLRLPRADRWLAAISMDSDHVVGDALAALRGCKALTSITLHTNAGLNSAHSLATLRRWWPSMTYLSLYSTQSFITGSLADLPASMTYLSLYSTQSFITGSLADLPASMRTLRLANTQSLITGSLADLPASMRTLRLYGTQSLITGALADLPASMTVLYLSNTQSVITGGGAATSRKLIDVRLQDLGLDQPTVDSILYSLYLAAITPRTDTGGVINVGGTNAAPSGTYQAAAACPVTVDTDGAEIAYELLNDGCSVGFPKWATVTITAP